MKIKQNGAGRRPSLWELVFEFSFMFAQVRRLFYVRPNQKYCSEIMPKKLFPIAAVVIAFLTSSCSSIPTRQVEVSSITKQNKAEQSSQFIGFAGGRAFKLVRLIPLFGGSPNEVIWWCPSDELTPSEIDSLRAMTSGSKP